MLVGQSLAAGAADAAFDGFHGGELSEAQAGEAVPSCDALDGDGGCRR